MVELPTYISGVEAFRNANPYYSRQRCSVNLSLLLVESSAPADRLKILVANSLSHEYSLAIHNLFPAATVQLASPAWRLDWECFGGHISTSDVSSKEDCHLEKLLLSEPWIFLMAYLTLDARSV